MLESGFFLQIIQGLQTTLSLAGCALLVGLSLGIACTIIYHAQLLYLRSSLKIILLVLRGLPEVLILFFIYFGFSQILALNAFTAGVLALGLIFAAYAVEVFDGALHAIDQGQTEAGLALGFTRKQVFWQIILPQLWRHALPGLGNLWLVLLKDTAIVTLIGLSDMMDKARVAAATTHQPFLFYLVAAGIYLIITACSQYVLNRLSNHVNRSLRVTV